MEISSIHDEVKNSRNRLSLKNPVVESMSIKVMEASPTIYNISKYNCFADRDIEISSVVIKDMIEKELRGDDDKYMDRLIPVYFIKESKETIVGYTRYDLDTVRSNNFDGIYIWAPTFIGTPMAELAKFSYLYRSFTIMLAMNFYLSRFEQTSNATKAEVKYALIVVTSDCYDCKNTSIERSTIAERKKILRALDECDPSPVEENDDISIPIDFENNENKEFSGEIFNDIAANESIDNHESDASKE